MDFLSGLMLNSRVSRGLHYTSSVFEGERAYGGKIFEIRHTKRLLGLLILGFNIPYGVEEICKIRKMFRANNITDGYIRPVAWRGSEMMGISAQDNTIHFAVA